MQTLSFAATVQGCPVWLKSTARATLALVIIKGAAWLAASWLALRGFDVL